jgi:hypothetical protein
VQGIRIVLTDFLIASAIIEAGLLAIIGLASIYALRVRSITSTARFLCTFGISSAIFGTGYLLEPAVHHVLGSDRNYGPVFFLEFYPGTAIANGLIWASGGLLPGLIFTVALFFTRANASPLLATIFAAIALVGSDLLSVLVCSLTCPFDEFSSARDGLAFSLASDLVGGPVGGLVGYWFFHQIRDRKQTLAEQSTRLLIGVFTGLVVLCASYLLFAHPLPTRLGLALASYSGASMRRSIDSHRNLEGEGPVYQKIASSYFFSSPTKNLHFYSMLATYPISLTAGDKGAIKVKAMGFANCRTKEEVAKLVARVESASEHMLPPGSQVEFRGSHQALDLIPRNSNANSSVRVGNGERFDFYSAQEDGGRLRKFFYWEDADVEIPITVGDMVVVEALPEWFEFSDREGKLPKSTSQIESPGVVFRTAEEKLTLDLPLIPHSEKCQSIEFASSRSQDRSVAERDLVSPYFVAVQIVGADVGATLTLGIELGWLTVPWTNDQIAGPDRAEDIDFFYAIAGEGNLSVGTERIQLQHGDHIVVAGDTVSLSELKEGSIQLAGTTKYITLNGRRLTPSLWNQLDAEFRSLIVAACIAGAGWFWRTQLVQMFRAMFRRS